MLLDLTDECIAAAQGELPDAEGGRIHIDRMVSVLGQVHGGTVRRQLKHLRHRIPARQEPEIARNADRIGDARDEFVEGTLE